MKNLLKKAGLYLKYAAVTTALAVTEGIAIAQDNLGEQLLQETNRQFVGLGNTLVTLLRTVLIIGGVVMIVVIVYDIMKGEREAAQKLGKWFAGLVVGFVVMEILLRFLR